MNGDVVKFPGADRPASGPGLSGTRPEELRAEITIWTCDDCSHDEFWLRTDGVVVCARCEEPQAGFRCFEWDEDGPDYAAD